MRWSTAVILTAVALILIALALAGCATATRPRPVQTLPHLDSGLAAGCDRPVAIPDQPLTPGAVNALWTRDRVSLADCADRQAAILTYYDRTRQALAPTTGVQR